MTTTGKNRIMIYGPKTDGIYVVEFRTTDGIYVVEFRTAEGESLAILTPCVDEISGNSTTNSHQ
jgi:hypothetical protein